jgi:hypothetical protein
VTGLSKRFGESPMAFLGGGGGGDEAVSKLEVAEAKVAKLEGKRAKALEAAAGAEQVAGLERKLKKWRGKLADAKQSQVGGAAAGKSTKKSTALLPEEGAGACDGIVSAISATAAQLPAAGVASGLAVVREWCTAMTDAAAVAGGKWATRDQELQALRTSMARWQCTSPKTNTSHAVIISFLDIVDSVSELHRIGEADASIAVVGTEHVG